MHGCRVLIGPRVGWAGLLLTRRCHIPPRSWDELPGTLFITEEAGRESRDGQRAGRTADDRAAGLGHVGGFQSTAPRTSDSIQRTIHDGCMYEVMPLLRLGDVQPKVQCARKISKLLSSRVQQ